MTSTSKPPRMTRHRVSPPTTPRISDPPANPIRWWTPRSWVGAEFFGWMRLLARNRFAVDFAHLHMAVAATFYGMLNSTLGSIQSICYRHRLARMKSIDPPIFILGHWRCGTTLLHELLILDANHAFPNTYQCFASNHFLLTEYVGSRALAALLPAQRPMDNMALGWDRPQEEEFALCNLGVPSPYLSILLPNEPPQYPEYLDLEGISSHELERWKQAFVSFLKQVTYRTGKRLVLKSPPHTARIKVLLDMFPDARFVHIARNPYVLFPSTMHLWKALFQTQGFQTPNFQGLEEYVYETFNRLHFKYQETRQLIAPNRLFEMRYEDLLHDPDLQMKQLYEQLELGDFNLVRNKIATYFSQQRTYQTNRYAISDEARAEIASRWADYFRVHGYSTEAAIG